MFGLDGTSSKLRPFVVSQPPTFSASLRMSQHGSKWIYDERGEINFAFLCLLPSHSSRFAVLSSFLCHTHRSLLYMKIIHISRAFMIRIANVACAFCHLSTTESGKEKRNFAPSHEENGFGLRGNRVCDVLLRCFIYEILSEPASCQQETWPVKVFEKDVRWELISGNNLCKDPCSSSVKTSSLSVSKRRLLQQKFVNSRCRNLDVMIKYSVSLNCTIISSISHPFRSLPEKMLAYESQKGKGVSSNSLINLPTLPSLTSYPRRDGISRLPRTSTPTKHFVSSGFCVRISGKVEKFELCVKFDGFSENAEIESRNQNEGKRTRHPFRFTRHPLFTLMNDENRTFVCWGNDRGWGSGPCEWLCRH